MQKSLQTYTSSQDLLPNVNDGSQSITIEGLRQLFEICDPPTAAEIDGLMKSLRGNDHEKDFLITSSFGIQLLYNGKSANQHLIPPSAVKKYTVQSFQDSIAEFKEVLKRSVGAKTKVMESMNAKLLKDDSIRTIEQGLNQFIAVLWVQLADLTFVFNMDNQLQQHTANLKSKISPDTMLHAVWHDVR